MITIEERARLAVQGTRAAWAKAEVPSPGTIRRRERVERNARMAQIAVAVVVIAALIFSVLPRTAGEDDSKIAPIGPRPREQERAPKAPETKAGDRAVQQRERSPVSETEGGARVAPNAPVPVESSCVFDDPKGDVDNVAIDILESGVSYDASRNALVIRHVLDDIPATPPLPNEALAYEFYFTLSGVRYRTLAYIGAASYGEWYFSVDRHDRTRSEQWPDVPQRFVMHPTGRVDTEADTVTVEVNLDEFNRGERAASDQEGLPPAAELKRGSTLANVRLISYPRSAGAGPYDEAYGCDYVVPGS